MPSGADRLAVWFTVESTSHVSKVIIDVIRMTRAQHNMEFTWHHQRFFGKSRLNCCIVGIGIGIWNDVIVINRDVSEELMLSLMKSWTVWNLTLLFK